MGWRVVGASGSADREILRMSIIARMRRMASSSRRTSRMPRDEQSCHRGAVFFKHGDEGERVPGEEPEEIRLSMVLEG